jgi:tRNA modification GTPase
LGIARSRQALAAAGLVVLVLDRSQPLTVADRVVIDELIEALAATSERRRPLLVALNKSDRPALLDEAALRSQLGAVPLVATAALTGAGIAELEEALTALALAGQRRAEVDPALLTLRQTTALAAAQTALGAARTALTAGRPVELVAIDLRAALERLGEITGESVSESLLDEIFSRFCIGK